MTSDAKTPKEYLDSLPDERKAAMTKIRKILRKHLPEGFKETMSGMLHYVVPHKLYPDGYHCNPEQPLPFVSLASQKNFIGLYHMGIYATKDVHDWFVSEFPKHSKRKLDMGKSCIRFKKMDDIPYELIAGLAAKITPEDWIKTYEANLKR